MAVGKKHEKRTKWTEDDIILDIVDYVEQGGDIRSSAFCDARRNTANALVYYKIPYRTVLEKARTFLVERGHDELARKFENYDSHLHRRDAFQQKSSLTLERLLDAIRFHDLVGMSLDVTSVLKWGPRLYHEARRKSGSWKAAYEQATGKKYADVRRKRALSRELIIEELINAAREGADLRAWPLSQSHHTLTGAISKGRYFKSHREALETTRTHLLKRGETALAEQFDYEKLQQKTREARQQKKRVISAKAPEIRRSDQYTLDDIVARGLPADVVGERKSVSGREVESWLKDHGYVTVEEAATKLRCSPDTLRLYHTKLRPDAVVVVYRGTQPMYLFSEDKLATFGVRPRAAPCHAEINPEREYKIGRAHV